MLLNQSSTEDATGLGKDPLESGHGLGWVMGFFGVVFVVLHLDAQECGDQLIQRRQAAPLGVEGLQPMQIQLGLGLGKGPAGVTADPCKDARPADLV